MAITNIAVNFTPCVPGPIGGYNIEYRVVGDALYIDAGNFMSSPANISVSYPDGTQFEGIVHSPCGDVIWSTVTIPDEGCGCRFGYPGEDELAGEDRVFQLGTDYQVRFLGSVPGATKDSMFKVNNGADEGTAIYGIASGADGIAIRGEADGVAGSFISTGTTVDDHALVTSAVDGLGAFISSTNYKGAYIQTSSGGYSAELRTFTTTDNNQVHSNLLLNAISSIDPVADGFGQSIDFQTNTAVATTRISNQIISLWVTADDTTGQSVMIITGVTAGALQDILYLIGDGIIMLPLGLNDYVDDAAAAAGSPVIPVGGLYRNGSQMMIRVT